MVTEATERVLYERARDAVQSEIKLLAAELGIPPVGKQFAAIVARVTQAVVSSLRIEDDTFKNVQRVIDSSRKHTK